PMSIPRTAFQLDNSDWDMVNLCADILADANRYHQVCSSTRMPTLWQVIPAMKALSSRWEAKADDLKYALFHDALRKGLKKLLKYYKLLDDAAAYILALFLHPYFKLRYIEEQWGGDADFPADLENGDPDVHDWQKYACQVVKTTVKKYWDEALKAEQNDSDVELLPQAASKTKAGMAAADDSEDEYDRIWLRHLKQGKADTNGWKVELQ
ncbi:hypothetical protein C8T65DRAFT_537582, partial [Cerioporus squamosus]